MKSLPQAATQLSVFVVNKPALDFRSECKDLSFAPPEEVFQYYNQLNKDITHHISGDDICTPMDCVKTMLDYVPDELWQRPALRILDPCCGNGNFGAYCKFKTNPNNIWYNELNPIRLANCKKILNPANINNGDAFHLCDDFGGTWDLIMANPPYSGGGNKNQSLSNRFIEKSIDILSDGGYLCFITPNNFMTYNNKNTTLKKLLKEGSFLVLDNTAKKYFPSVGSSFTIFVWQKGIFNNKTLIKNNYLIKDVQQDVIIPPGSKFLPLYISQHTLTIIEKTLLAAKNKFNYRCDLHNFTQKDKLSDTQDDKFVFETIHTARKTRYATVKQDIFDKWTIIIPLSTYYVPFIKTNINVTQSVGYISFETKKEAEDYLEKIILPHYKLVVHLTRFGNFNNIMVLKHLAFDQSVKLTEDELSEINKLSKYIKY